MSLPRPDLAQDSVMTSNVVIGDKGTFKHLLFAVVGSTFSEKAESVCYCLAEMPETGSESGELKASQWVTPLTGSR